MAFSRMVGSACTTVLSVRLFRQSTLEIRVSAAVGTSEMVEMPTVSRVKPYFSTAASYSAMVDSEFASLVVYMIPMVLASGKISRIISSCFSTGSLSLVPVTLPTEDLSSLASSAATGSVMAV